jgi:DNA-binding transcriptional MerR regulator
MKPLNQNKMTADRIKEIQQETAFPDSISVCQALLKVWNECEQAKEMEKEQIEELKAEIKALKQVKDLNIPADIESVCLCTTPIGSTAPDKCGRCGKNIGWQTALCLIKQGPPTPPLDRKIYK